MIYLTGENMTPNIQWEYRIKEQLVLPIFGEVELLNNVGLDGWKLCCVLDGWDKQTKIYYFKRVINRHFDVLNEYETKGRLYNTIRDDDKMDNLDMNLLKLQTYQTQLKTAQIQLENAKLQRKLLDIQLQKESWQKAELDGRIHEVLNDDEIEEREKQYASKR